jgi:hypothetical protein
MEQALEHRAARTVRRTPFQNDAGHHLFGSKVVVREIRFRLDFCGVGVHLYTLPDAFFGRLDFRPKRYRACFLR